MDYDLLLDQVIGLLAGETDFIASAANFAAFVFNELAELNWAGFYFPAPSGELVLGPFNGRPACTRLPRGRGVCGAAFTSGRTMVVDDVHAFADHIACDSASLSEIVVPLCDDGRVFGVFDVDSPIRARFSAQDRAGIEGLVGAFVAHVRGSRVTPS
ncbi:MAG TPA: GAF domain-containing protein [Candidatus Acidoferrales bacterium]|nr:GAF domain-containing protein [Candidatus Acidoferrales bacterium]